MKPVDMHVARDSSLNPADGQRRNFVITAATRWQQHLLAVLC